MILDEFITNYKDIHYHVVLEQNYYGIVYCEMFRIYIYDTFIKDLVEKFLHEKTIKFSQIIYDEGKISESFKVGNIILNSPNIPIYSLEQSKNVFKYIFEGSLNIDVEKYHCVIVN